MFNLLRTRIEQKYRTMAYPDGPPPPLPSRFAGRPTIAPGRCADGCDACAAACPVGAITMEGGSPALDTGQCLFCRACRRACPSSAIRFTQGYRLAAARREDLVVRAGSPQVPAAYSALAGRLFRRSLKLRQVSAGGCNACEADSNVLTTLAWDIGRFGIQFVASPRHADGLLITGPVTENMRLALQKTYDAVPAPKIVIAVGACAVSGGLFWDHGEQHNGAASVVPVDLFVPGCPPHPLTILDGLLTMLGIVPSAPSQERTLDA
ncbi:MAG: hydrogenase [Planctomycetes bacterium]|nr:hydrogenase [Planctomycetota bacterium]